MEIHAEDVLDAWRRTVGSDPGGMAFVSPSVRLDRVSADTLVRRVTTELAAADVGIRSIVAVSSQHPVDVFLGALAVLDAGAAFTILDPWLPPEEVARRFRRLGVAAVVTGGSTPCVPQVRREGTETSSAETAEPPGSRRDDLAYVIFTSGSTGEPKAVMIDRGNLSLFCRSLADRLALTDADVWLQLASPGFDVVIEEVFPVLVAGGTVYCRDRFEPPTPAELHALTRFSGCTILELSTQHWYEFLRWLERNDEAPGPSIRTLVVGGERMDPDAYRRWQSRWTTLLVHVYGLTECTVTSTMYHGVLPAESTVVPIGTPIDGCTVTIDSRGGEPGEIVIGGPLVGRGYFGDEDATARHFVPTADGLVYRTGDSGQIVDGQLEFLGRRDTQLKVRGHRIEVASIEQALARCPGIGGAAVVVDPITPTSLVAVVLLNRRRDGGRVAASDEVVARAHEHLRRSLMPWELPDRYVELDAMPLNEHGKIDRARLSTVVGNTTRARASASRADTDSDAGGDADVLEIVIRTFRASLGDDIDATSDFFEFGGNSLLAMRVSDEINVALAVDLVSPSLLFDLRTPRAVASMIDAIS